MSKYTNLDKYKSYKNMIERLKKFSRHIRLTELQKYRIDQEINRLQTFINDSERLMSIIKFMDDSGDYDVEIESKMNK